MNKFKNKILEIDKIFYSKNNLTKTLNVFYSYKNYKKIYNFILILLRFSYYKPNGIYHLIN